MVTYGSKLVLFGGYGNQLDHTQPGANFFEDGNYGNGWTNELHIFDLETGEARELELVYQKSYCIMVI